MAQVEGWDPTVSVPDRKRKKAGKIKGAGKKSCRDVLGHEQ